MGVLIRELSDGKYYSLLAFNIRDEGRLIKSIEYIKRGQWPLFCWSTLPA